MMNKIIENSKKHPNTDFSPVVKLNDARRYEHYAFFWYCNLGLKVCEKVNGESIEQDLKEIYAQSDNPKATIKDGDSTLGKGVRLWSERQELVIPAVQDISHVMTNALKNNRRQHIRDQ